MTTERRYYLYLSRAGDDDTQTAGVSFAHVGSARRFLDELGDWTETDDVELADVGTSVQTSDGVVASTRFWPDRMREVVCAEPGSLSRTLVAVARWFRAGPNLPRTLDERRVEEPRRAVRSAPRASRAGLVPAADVALSLNMTPRDLRAALRRLRVPKPAAGWAWTPEEADRIRKLVRS